MAEDSLQALPADLFHLLSTELSDRLDFPTLYHVSISSKQLASYGAISALYRISHQAPVKGGGEGLPLAEQELTVQRWSILWRTTILSAFGKTIYPYCRHLRSLDLRDLADLLDDDKFRGKVAKHFFTGELAKFHFVQQASGRGRQSRLEIKRIITAIGDEITKHAPQLESLSEPANTDILSSALLEWAPRLTNLMSLDLWDGKALANETIRNLLHAHCPNLSSLRVYTSANEDADHHMAAFISGMQDNSLVYFENISGCGIGAETCLALNGHGKSLHSLKLHLDNEGIQGLALLQGCTALELLAVTASTTSTDLKSTQHDVFLEIVAWLKNCHMLTDVSFNNVLSAPDLLLPVLLNQDIKLESLQINATEGTQYVVKDHQDFHQALSQQPSLRSLLLRADPDPAARDDIETLMNAFCSLKGLRELRLTRISDYFTDEHIALLAQHLHNLEDLYIGGYGISDAVWSALAKLPSLKAVTFIGITSFTETGILDFINQLDDTHHGFSVTVDNADPDNAISTESQELIREVIAKKLDGRFEYTLLRDNNMSDFGSDDSD